MIPKMRAIAIDDQPLHLDAIHKAATRAGFGCVPLLYPTNTDAEQLAGLALHQAHVRIIITDLHLSSTSETSDPRTSYGVIGGLITLMNIPKWTPYVLVLWTAHPDAIAGLKTYLEERLDPERMPGLVVGLAKADYGIADQEVNHDQLWKDLSEKVTNSRGLNLLLQWEKEVIAAADNVVGRLVALARSDGKKSISFDDELDRILSLIGQTATSRDFATTAPRAAANSGLLPLLIDEMEHISLTDGQSSVWSQAMSRAKNGDKLNALKSDIAGLNDAFHISRDGVSTGSDRGAVISSWHNSQDFAAIFGMDRANLKEMFGIQDFPEVFAVKYIQIEGLCDSTQKKKGVVPFTLGIEVPAATVLKDKNYLPASVEVSPVYFDKDGKTERKLIVNLRYFFTLERGEAKLKKADFRIRESLISKWATSWASHAIRPGTVEFHLR
jgi:hypothetical protein